MYFFHYVGLLSGLIGGIGMIPYIKDILFGKTRPERASFVIWSILGLIAFFSQMAEGATTSLWMTGFSTLNCIIILVLSIKKGRGGMTKRDVKSLLIAGIGLLLWFYFKRGLFALLLTIFVDGIGTYLTVTKTYKEPQTETLSSWIAAVMAGFLGIISVGKFDLILLLYPLYIFIGNSSIVAAIVLGRNKKLLK